MGAGLWKFPCFIAWFIQSEELCEGTAQGKKEIKSKKVLTQLLTYSYSTRFLETQQEEAAFFPNPLRKLWKQLINITPLSVVPKLPDMHWQTLSSRNHHQCRVQNLGYRPWHLWILQRAKAEKKAHSRQLQPQNPSAIPKKQKYGVSRECRTKKKIKQSKIKA